MGSVVDTGDVGNVIMSLIEGMLRIWVVSLIEEILGM